MDDFGFLDTGGATPPQRAPALSPDRLGRITASMADVVMGKQGEQTEKYARALAWERVYGERDEGFHGKWMERGQRLEPKALEWYKTHEGVDLDFGPGFKIHRSLKMVGASPDGMASRGRAKWTVQAKCPGSDAWMVFLDSRRPGQYEWQCRWEAWVCGNSKTDLVVWHPKSGGIVIPVPLKSEHAREMSERALALEDRVAYWIKVLLEN